MPFKVKFDIYEPGKSAPCYTSYDKTAARLEFMGRKKDNAWIYMLHDIQTIDLTQHEKYVWLVYQVRKAIYKYYHEGRNHDDLLASLALEKQLDDWNTRTRIYLNNHPNCQIDEKAKSFFLLVDTWRDKWHKYFATKKAHSEPQQVIDEMKKECFDYEKQIDKYVKQVIGLI